MKKRDILFNTALAIVFMGVIVVAPLITPRKNVEITLHQNIGASLHGATSFITRGKMTSALVYQTDTGDILYFTGKDVNEMVKTNADRIVVSYKNKTRRNLLGMAYLSENELISWNKQRVPR